MSFYSNNRNCITCPGPISGNPLNGLNERVCIQTTKVFDSCMKQSLYQDVVLNVNFEGTPTEPLTYIGAVNDPSRDTTITNLVIDRLVERPNYARVSGTINIPVIVSFTDANTNPGTGTSSFSIPFDVVLFVPQPSIVPYSVQAFANASSNVGSWTSGNIFTVDFCVTFIIRVVVQAEICVPSYGYCQIPPCVEFSQDQCTGVFELPLFPTAAQ